MNLKKLAVLALAGAMALGSAAAQTNPGQSPLSIAKGGTGAITAAAARTSLGINAALITSLCNPFSSSAAGCVGASGGGTANFLRADGTWAAPPLANPTGSVGLSVVNGAAATYLRSDAAPALSSSVQSALTQTSSQVLIGTGSFGFSSVTNAVLASRVNAAIPITACGADPTGVADSQSAINTCLSTYQNVSIPYGTYTVGCTGGNGIAITSGQSLIGLDASTSIIKYNCTSGIAINMSGGVGIVLSQFSIDRASGTPVSGAGIGSSTSTMILQDCVFSDLIVSNQWNGYAWPPANFSSIRNAVARSNYNDGHDFVSTATSGVMQYQINNIASELNNRYGYYIDGTAAASTTFLSWNHVETFANGVGGIRAVGSSGHTVNDLNIAGLTASYDNNDCVFINSFGINNSITGSFFEGCGVTGLSRGRGSLIAATNSGSGVSVQNNINIVVTGNTFDVIANHGVITDGTNTNVNISDNMISRVGQATANTYDGIRTVGTTERLVITGNNVYGTTNKYGINSATVSGLISSNNLQAATAGCNFTGSANGVNNIGTSCIDVVSNQLYINGGAFNVTGSVAPQYNLVPTSGATAQVYNDGTNYNIGTNGVGQWLAINLSTGMTAAKRGFSTPAPVTKTANYTVTDSDSSLIFNCAGSCTLTLPAASSYSGRWIYVKTLAAQTVVSASSNVAPLTSATAGTAILSASSGKWANLQSDGTNWIVMAGN